MNVCIIFGIQIKLKRTFDTTDSGCGCARERTTAVPTHWYSLGGVAAAVVVAELSGLLEPGDDGSHAQAVLLLHADAAVAVAIHAADCSRDTNQPPWAAAEELQYDARR